MTFQEAQTRFSSIVGGVDANTSADEILRRQRDLHALLASLPNTAEFDPIATAITELSPKLVGMLAHSVVRSLQAREASLREAATLLTRVSSRADADARALTLEKPRLVAAALVESVAALREVRAAVEERRFEEAASKVDALVTLIEQVRVSIKTG